MRSAGFPCRLAGCDRAFVGGLHNSAAAARYDCESFLCHFVGGFLGELVILMLTVCSGGAENRSGRAHGGQFLETLHEFGHYPEYAPKVFNRLACYVRHHKKYSFKILFFAKCIRGLTTVPD